MIRDAPALFSISFRPDEIGSGIFVDQMVFLRFLKNEDQLLVELPYVAF